MVDAKLIINGNFFDLTFNDGNSISGYFEGGTAYRVVFAEFNGSDYLKEIGWKRRRRGQTSKNFLNWVAEAEKVLYNQVYGLSK